MRNVKTAKRLLGKALNEWEKLRVINTDKQQPTGLPSKLKAEGKCPEELVLLQVNCLNTAS